MRGRIFASLFLCSLFFVVAGDAQNRDVTERPVWTLEFIQLLPGNNGLAMGYLDDHWMRVRAEAKKEGAVLDYHRIQSVLLVTPGHKMGGRDGSHLHVPSPDDPNSLVLITEYKNMDAFMQSEKLFASIQERLPKSTPGVLRPTKPDDLYETVDTSVFVEEPDTGGGFKLIAKR